MLHTKLAWLGGSLLYCFFPLCIKLRRASSDVAKTWAAGPPLLRASEPVASTEQLTRGLPDPHLVSPLSLSTESWSSN